MLSAPNRSRLGLVLTLSLLGAVVTLGATLAAPVRAAAKHVQHQPRPMRRFTDLDLLLVLCAAPRCDDAPPDDAPALAVRRAFTTYMAITLPSGAALPELLPTLPAPPAERAVLLLLPPLPPGRPAHPPLAAPLLV